MPCQASLDANRVHTRTQEELQNDAFVAQLHDESTPSPQQLPARSGGVPTVPESSKNSRSCSFCSDPTPTHHHARVSADTLSQLQDAGEGGGGGGDGGGGGGGGQEQAATDASWWSSMVGGEEPSEEEAAGAQTARSEELTAAHAASEPNFNIDYDMEDLEHRRVSMRASLSEIQGTHMAQQGATASDSREDGLRQSVRRGMGAEAVTRRQKDTSKVFACEGHNEYDVSARRRHQSEVLHLYPKQKHLNPIEKANQARLRQSHLMTAHLPESLKGSSLSSLF